jgi:hypothetical protein
VNRTLFLILAIAFLSSCELRTSSKIRFERACDIKLPKNYEVVQDEYQDMVQDFVINYTIKFDTTSQQKLTSSIRHSKYYDSEFNIQFHDLPVDIIDPKIEAIWIKSFDGYRFINSNYQHSFSAIIDTIHHQAKFTESSD